MKIVLQFILLIFSAYALGQPVNYIDDGRNVERATDGVISSSKPFVEVFFASEDEIFQPPYTISYAKSDGTLVNGSTSSDSWIVKLGDTGISYLQVVDANGVAKTFCIEHTRSMWPWVMGGAVFLLVLVIIMLLVKLRRYLRQSHAKNLLERASEKHTKKYECSTVLFADIQGFTKIAEHMNPDQLVDELDRYFIFFDELVERFGVEKIKTIGDAYMCAGGVPETDSANPIEVALVGLGMINYVKERRAIDSGFWNIRVGLNTGPVISGNLGYKKKVFDIWGDSVNTASRMESSSEPGEVNVSDNTYQKIRDYFDCEHRGRMPVKYKGEIDMYFVKRLKPEYAEPGSIYKPNETLKLKMQILKSADLEDDIVKTFMKNTNQNVYNRFKMMLTRMELLARAERLSDSEYLSCRIAMILSFAQIEFSREAKVDSPVINSRLEKMKLSPEQMETIMKTVYRIVQNNDPENLIEEVIHDARYEYFGRRDLGSMLTSWFEAESEKHKHLSRKDWMNEQKSKLEGFHYFTDTARRLVEVNGDSQRDVIDMIAE